MQEGLNNHQDPFEVDLIFKVHYSKSYRESKSIILVIF